MDPRARPGRGAGDDVPTAAPPTSSRHPGPGRRRPGPARPRPPAGRRLAGHARAGPAPRPGTGPVRPAHRRLPGRPPPAGRNPGGHRGGRRRARLRLGGRLAGDGGRGQGTGRTQRPDRQPATASRCWPASGSPPSTTSTTTCGGPSCSTSCSASSRSLTRELGAQLLATRRLPDLCHPSDHGRALTRRGRRRSERRRQRGQQLPGALGRGDELVTALPDRHHP